jgi:predicted DNA-binding protein with PD1-like motif
MKWQQVEGPPAATYVLVLDPDEETTEVLTAFVRERGLRAAQVTAVGAFKRAVVGWFDRDEKDYRRIPVEQQCEVLSLVGDIAVGEDGPAPHVHAVLGLPDGTTRGGHLLEGEVWPTLEIVIRSSPATLVKTFRPEIGLALIDPSKEWHHAG